MGAPDGEFTLRRVSLQGSDLTRALPYLLDADPEGLRLCGRDTPIRVVDQAFDLADRALAAAHGQPPLADPEGWLDEDEFRSLVVDDPDVSYAVEPWAYHGGDLGAVAGVLAGMAVFTAVLFGVGFPLNDSLGLNTPERQDTLPDHVFGVVLLALACALAVLAYVLVVRLLTRQGRHHA